MDILNLIAQNEIDTLVTIWPRDAHKDHRVASEIALAATREVARVLLARVSWNSTSDAFRPVYFVDITQQCEAKRKVPLCYQVEYRRTGHLWEKFNQSQAQLYGLEANCEMAECFEVMKFRY